MERDIFKGDGIGTSRKFGCMINHFVCVPMARGVVY